MNVLHWLREKARALFALAILALAIAAIAIATGAPPGIAIVATVIVFVAVASIAPDVGLMLFAWILTEAKKAARNATPHYATTVGSINPFTRASDRHDRWHFGDTNAFKHEGRLIGSTDDGITGGGRSSARWDAGTNTDHDTMAEGRVPLRD